jgi:endonuclease/exonuclease/phosphatase family metal-dependent hydrolase
MNPSVSLAVGLLVATGIACQHRVATIPAVPFPPHCIGPSPEMWSRAPQDPDLDLWCAQVGPPLVVHAPAEPAVVTRLVIVSWNVQVGGGRVMELFEWLRKRAAAEGATVGFVLLLQEAYRAGGDMQATVDRRGIPNRIRPVRPALDVEALARYLHMSAVYVPSMRNGDAESPDEWEDRGNAILSTEPVSDIMAIELPFGAQRRVATAATITPRGAAPFRAIAAHFDTFWHRSAQRRQAEWLAIQLEQLLNESRLPIVMGADTNARAGAPLVASCSDGPSTPYFLRFDFLFTSFAPANVQNCRTLPDEYGSDHRPVILSFDTAPQP